ncbi:MAG: site-specific integrase [Pseudomonadota bacterium]
MRIDLPGLLIEKHRNGTLRYRVRVARQKTRRIAIPVPPDHPDFLHHYHAARAGETWAPAAPKHAEHSLDWLVALYLRHFEKMVQAGQSSAHTLKQKRSVLTRLCDFRDHEGTRYGDCHMKAPSSALVIVRDEWAATPGAANYMLKAASALFSWACARDHMAHNPAAGIAFIDTGPKKGATAWTARDLKAFKKAHPKGSTAYLWLTLQAFTACRIGDAVWLGRDQEVTFNGQVWLEWQPRKKNSAPVSIPMLPPLFEATRECKVIGPSYILNENGTPFSSTAALGVRVRRWCDAAGLKCRSSHGVRKAVAELLAESGCSQHEIMAVMAHTEARTSEIYTRSAERKVLAANGMEALKKMTW